MKRSLIGRWKLVLALALCTVAVLVVGVASCQRDDRPKKEKEIARAFRDIRKWNRRDGSPYALCVWVDRNAILQHSGERVTFDLTKDGTLRYHFATQIEVRRPGKDAEMRVVVQRQDSLETRHLLAVLESNGIPTNVIRSRQEQARSVQVTEKTPYAFTADLTAWSDEHLAAFVMTLLKDVHALQSENQVALQIMSLRSWEDGDEQGAPEE
jgi:hypothetical protein